MEKYVLKNKIDIEDFVKGCTFYGTGGGGTPEAGLSALSSEMEKGTELHWIDYSDVPDDALVVSTYLMGSIAPLTDEMREDMKKYNLDTADNVFDYKEQMIQAVKELEEYIGKKFYGVVCVEIGAANSSAPVAVANALGIPAINGDYAGRAIPELTQTTARLFNKQLYPLVSVDCYGNTAIVKKTCNQMMVERLGKLLSMAAYGLVGNASLVMTGKEMKEIVIPGTLKRSLDAGRYIREFQNADDPVKEVTSAIGCHIAGRGKVVKKETYVKDGYYYGTLEFEGVGECSGHTYKVWFQNENHVCWEDSKAIVMSPDIITMVDNNNCEPTTNDRIQEGDELAIIGIKGSDSFMSEGGFNIIGPKHFGFDFDFISVEETLAGK